MNGTGCNGRLGKEMLALKFYPEIAGRLKRYCVGTAVSEFAVGRIEDHGTERRKVVDLVPYRKSQRIVDEGLAAIWLEVADGNSGDLVVDLKRNIALFPIV